MLHISLDTHTRKPTHAHVHRWENKRGALIQLVAQGQTLHVRTQTTHVHARVYGSARKSGRTNARWQLALATKGEGRGGEGKTRGDDNELQK